MQDSDIVKSSLSFLQKTGFTEYLLEKLTGIALKTGKISTAWTLLEMLSSELRPHYFWPLLISANKEAGEVGNTYSFYFIYCLNFFLLNRGFSNSVKNEGNECSI